MESIIVRIGLRRQLTALTIMRVKQFHHVQSYSAQSYRAQPPYATTLRNTRTYTDLFHKIDGDYSDEEIAKARQWLTKFEVGDIPRDRFEVLHARSSGPGGQNVNKLNTKVTIRCAWEDLSWIPRLIQDRLRQRHFRYLTKKDKVVVHSDTSRHRSENLEACFQKLHDMIQDCAFIPEDASPEKEKRWEEIRKRANAARLKEKHIRSAKKRARQTSEY